MELLPSTLNRFVYGRGDAHKRKLKANFPGGDKPRPYYGTPWQADPCFGRGDPCGRPEWWGLAKVRAYGALGWVRRWITWSLQRCPGPRPNNQRICMIN